MPVVDDGLCSQGQTMGTLACLTYSCRSTLTMRHDNNGTHTDETTIHTHPPNEATTASLTYKPKRGMRQRNTVRRRRQRVHLRRTSTDASSVRRFGSYSLLRSHFPFNSFSFPLRFKKVTAFLFSFPLHLFQFPLESFQIPPEIVSLSPVSSSISPTFQIPRESLHFPLRFSTFPDPPFARLRSSFGIPPGGV